LAAQRPAYGGDPGPAASGRPHGACRDGGCVLLLLGTVGAFGAAACAAAARPVKREDWNVMGGVASACVWIVLHSVPMFY
jgi:hypothetical protein